MIFLKIKVPNTLICTFVIFSQIWFILPYVLYAIDKKILLSYVNGPIYVILCVILMSSIYIDLIRNKALLYETLNFLDDFIAKG